MTQQIDPSCLICLLIADITTRRDRVQGYVNDETDQELIETGLESIAEKNELLEMLGARRRNQDA